MVKRIFSNCINTQEENSMERIVITVKDKRSSNVKGLSEKILKPLLEIVYQYKSSQAYNYLPRTKEEGWEYYEGKFKEIYANLDSMVELDEETYEKARNLIVEIHSFASQCCYVDALPKRYLRFNPNLRYYIPAYEILENSSMECFAKCVAEGRLKHVPTYEEIKRRDMYFAEKEFESKELNLQYDEEDYFMEDVAKALRTAFRRDLKIA